MNTAAFLASAGGAGFAPRAPGTAGAALGLIIGAALLSIGHLPLLTGILAASAAGLWSIRAAGGQNDPGWIVIDEVAGQMIALLALPRVTWPGLLAAFALFRAFDIAKPGPIAWADARHDAIGVMADDWLAGAAAFLVLLILVLAFPGLTK